MLINPLTLSLTRFAPLWAPEDEGSGQDTGSDAGEDATDGGEGGADANAGGTPEPVLGGGTGDKADDNSDDGEDASKESGSEGDDGADGEEGKDEDNSVPEGDADYAFTLPEGVEMDEALASEMTPLLKELKIGQADANKLAASLTGYLQKQAETYMNDYVTKVEGWTEAAKNDKELGADWNATVAVANNGLQKFGTPELTAALAETGMSNNPEMIRFMYRVAKATGNDVLDRGKNVDTSDLPPEQSWYGKTTPSKKAG